MNAFFVPYEGKRPFLFISYAHATTDQVIPAIRLLHEGQYRIWYDEGIPAGADWPETVADHMRRCGAVLFFFSEPAVNSSNCFNEISAARALRKPILAISLDNSSVPDRWVPLLEGVALIHPETTEPRHIEQSILLSGFVDKAFLREPGEAKAFQDGRPASGRHFWLRAILTSLLLLALAAGVYGLSQGWFPAILPELVTPAPTQIASPTALPTAPPEMTEIPTPALTFDPREVPEGFLETPIDFPDKQQERAVRAAIGLPEGTIYNRHLTQIVELLFCGTMNLKSMEGVRIIGDDECSVNGAPVLRGVIKNLSSLGGIPSLERLSLVFQQITDILPLNNLIYLQELDLSMNPLENLAGIPNLDLLTTLHLEYTGVSDLSPLKDLERLTVLHLEYTNVKDLSPLHSLKNLKSVTVSAEMFPLTIGSKNPRFDLILVP